MICRSALKRSGSQEFFQLRKVLFGCRENERKCEKILNLYVLFYKMMKLTSSELNGCVSFSWVGIFDFLSRLWLEIFFIKNLVFVFSLHFIGNRVLPAVWFDEETGWKEIKLIWIYVFAGRAWRRMKDVCLVKVKCCISLIWVESGEWRMLNVLSTKLKFLLF